MKRSIPVRTDSHIYVLREHHDADVIVERLASLVSDVASSVCNTLGTGLPRSVYQATFYNQLEQVGLQLETMPSQLGKTSDLDGGRDIVIVDGRLIIECILEYELQPEMRDVYRSRLGFDVKSNGYDMGMVVNFGQRTNNPDKNIH